jgi:hypothetical protein
MSDTGWHREFDDPIPLPNRKPLATLRDAALYITKLPKAEHDAPEWQAAMAALLLVAEHNGPTMMARIGVMRALNRHKPKAVSVPRRKRTKALQDCSVRPALTYFQKRHDCKRSSGRF